MKKRTFLITAGLFLLISFSAVVAMAHKTEGDSTKSISRKVEVVRTSHELTVTITTSENGISKTEVLKGDEAEKWLKENPFENHSSAETTVKMKKVKRLSAVAAAAPSSSMQTNPHPPKIPLNSKK